MSKLTQQSRKIQPLTVLLFYADGIQIKETEQLEKKLKDLLPGCEFFKINVYTNPKMGESFHVCETPLMLILKHGREIWRQANRLSETELLFLLNHKSGQQENELSQH